MGQTVIVIGMGEVGQPLLELVGEHHDAIGIDITPVEYQGQCDVMHICYPFGTDDFIGQTVAYMNRYAPRLAVINSTVAPGTTRAVYQATGAPIAYSPVRGKSRMMKQDLLRYVKFVGGINEESGQEAAEHFRSLGMRTTLVTSPEAAELAKVTETTYFGLLIAWAQEVERYCDKLSLSYDEIASFYQEVGFFPPVEYFPGVIGGHCVMPNIAILKTLFDSDLLDAIERSNQQKAQRDEALRQTTA